MKQLTYQQVEGRKEKAARFVENVLHDSDRAEEIEDESVEDYADRRKIRIVNPRTPSKARARLLRQLRQLEGENAALREQLDAIAAIAADDVGEQESFQ